MNIIEVDSLASGAGEPPIRFISTLEPGQCVVISVPRASGQPSLDFEILRTGDRLLVSDPISTAAVDLAAGSPHWPHGKDQSSADHR